MSVQSVWYFILISILYGILLMYIENLRDVTYAWNMEKKSRTELLRIIETQKEQLARFENRLRGKNL